MLLLLYDCDVGAALRPSLRKSTSYTKPRFPGSAAMLRTSRRRLTADGAGRCAASPIDWSVLLLKSAHDRVLFACLLGYLGRLYFVCVCACANDLGSAGRICGSRYRLVDSEVVAAVAL